MNDKISILLSARKNSKYLAKFLFGFLEHTGYPGDIEVLVMLNKGDTWNRELAEYFTVKHPQVKFFREDYGLGRAGLHYYFNDLLRQAKGDWIIYFCEDHFINSYGWDNKVRAMIQGSLNTSTELGPVAKHNHGRLDPSDIWVLVPKFDNCGAMNHIVSRGFVNAMGGVLGRHGWIDSYVNDLMAAFPERVIRFDNEMFHDFTHDHPNPMSNSQVQSVSTKKGKELPAYKDPETRLKVEADQEKLRTYMEVQKNG